MPDPTTALITAIESATKVANTSLFTTVIDKISGFKISQWAAEGEVRKKQILAEYEKAKNGGIVGIQYISALRAGTNLINTAVKTSKYIKQGKPNEIEMDNDFFWNTIEHSKNVSNEEMQELIAKIIAGEYNVPGTYSMSTLQTVKMLGKNELELFEKTCSLLVDNARIPATIFSLPDDAKDLMNELGVDFGSFQTLQSLGLFLPSDMVMTMSNPEKKKFSILYFDKSIWFESENENYLKLEMPDFYKLSMVGTQILKHLNPRFNEKYFIWLKRNYKISNYKILE